MKLCLSSLPKLKNCFYLTNRLRQTSRPSLAIPLSYYHLLPKALYFDNMAPLSEVDDYVDREGILREFKLEGLNLEILETVDYRHENMVKKLRGHFTSEEPKSDESRNIVVSIVQGLENTSLLSALSVKAENYVFDLRDFSFRINFLKSILSILEVSGNAYVVVDNPEQDLMALSEEVLIGLKANILSLSRMVRDVHSLNSGMKLVRSTKTNCLEVEKSDVEWLWEEEKVSPEWVEPREVDYLKIIIGSGEESKKIITCVIDILKNLFEIGSVNERDWFTQFTDKGLQVDYARLVSYFLERYGIVTPLLSPAGRNYVLPERGKRIVLRHQRRGEKKEG